MPQANNWPTFGKFNIHTDYFDRATRRNFVVGAVLVFALVNALIGLVSGPSIALDDVKINILTQGLQWGYLPSNPPLFEWLLTIVQQLTGPTIISFLIVKYGLLIATAGFFYAGFLEIRRDARLAGVGTLGLIGLYQIGYNYHQVFTHSLMLISMIGALCWITARLLHRPSTVNYAVLGIILGLGVLAKYSFAASIVIVALALLTRVEGRKVLRNWKIIPALIIGLMIITPHGLWQLAQSGALANDLGARVPHGGDYLARLLVGIPSVLWAMLAFFIPFGIVILINPAGVWSASKSVEPVWRRVLVIGSALMIAAVLVLGLESVQERYAIAFLLPGYFAFLIAIHDGLASRSQRNLVMVFLGVIIMIIPVIRTVQVFVPGTPFCSGCRQWIPYDPLAAAITAHARDVPQSSLTLVGFDDHTAGNLRRYFPRARILSSRLVGFVPRVRAPVQACLFIWSTDISGPPPPSLIASFGEQTRFVVNSPWHHPLRQTGWRVTRWEGAIVPQDNYAYGELCGVGKSSVHR